MAGSAENQSASENTGSPNAQYAVHEAAQRARKAAGFLAKASSTAKNSALISMAQALEASFASILEANEEDVAAARSTGYPAAFISRLTLSESKIRGMAGAVRALATLPDPVGRVLEAFERPNGLRIRKVSVPFGVVGVIYESRPNVTSDAASICLKSGSAAILKGGSESRQTNLAIVSALHRGLEHAGFPTDSVVYLDAAGRAGVRAMLHARSLIDLLIPRGGAGLIRTVVEEASVPVLETGVGNCHVYVHKDADPEMAASIILNAKCQNPSVCNAAETVLVDRDVAGSILPDICERLRCRGVEIRGCWETASVVPWVIQATEDDWDTEYLSLTLAIKVVDDLEEAIRHIAKHGTGHSEAIVTQDEKAAVRFQAEVDAACVYWNASTRFTDGGEFGFGGEMGISTQKLHARGPVGLNEMVAYKYLVSGSGQVRQ
ncbi:MAG TPA: glutamate-5-semialdehyde dehydrogenase [Firmicutes bacterium]|nr:glutamate-5-semialdehyde dehydrogenase [Candidatus Fermentithermobacillaceae bacterium]